MISQFFNPIPAAENNPTEWVLMQNEAVIFNIADEVEYYLSLKDQVSEDELAPEVLAYDWYVAKSEEGLLAGLFKNQEKEEFLQAVAELYEIVAIRAN